MTHAPTSTTTPNHNFDEEILQPHMIVPSQQALCGLELRCHESSVEMRTNWPSAGPFLSSATTSYALAEELREEQPHSTKMNG